MRHDLFATTVLASVFLVPSALAQCEEDQVTGTFVCEDEDTDGFASDEAGTVLVVLPEATVSAEEDAITLEGEGSSLDNQGDVTGGADGVVIGVGGTVTNAGRITGADIGIDADDRNGVQVFNTGIITGGTKDGDRGIRFDDGEDAVVENDGLIEAFGEAIEAGDRATIDNAGTIRSNGNDDGVQVQLEGDIVNRGTILGGLQNGDGIDIDSGTIFNAEGALIESRVRDLTGTEDGAEAGIDIDEGEGSVSIVNDGTIRGEIGILEDGGNTTGHVVSNAGEIIGVGGIAIDFVGLGDDDLSLLAGGTIEGDVLFGEGEDDLVLEGIMAANVGGGEGTLFDGGQGEDLVVFDLGVELGDVVNVVIGTALREADALSFRNEDGSLSTIFLISFELFEFGNEFYTIEELIDAVPVPGALPLMMAGLALGACARRRRA